MKLLQGNAQIGISILRILGIIGVLIGIASHFMTWTVIQTDGGKDVVITGYEGNGWIGILILIVFGLLLMLNSVYSILVLVFFIPYLLEQTIGINLLRYMPLESTKLQVGLYLYLPTGFFLSLIGSFAPVLSHIFKGK